MIVKCGTAARDVIGKEIILLMLPATKGGNRQERLRVAVRSCNESAIVACLQSINNGLECLRAAPPPPLPPSPHLLPCPQSPPSSPPPPPPPFLSLFRKYTDQPATQEKSEQMKTRLNSDTQNQIPKPNDCFFLILS